MNKHVFVTFLRETIIENLVATSTVSRVNIFDFQLKIQMKSTLHNSPTPIVLLSVAVIKK